MSTTDEDRQLHTPGPWRVYINAYDHPQYEVETTLQHPDDSTRCAIYTVARCGNAVDAQVIAALPSIVKALRAVRDYMNLPNWQKDDLEAAAHDATGGKVRHYEALLCQVESALVEGGLS
jgi:hypothetical protein